ncbi:hypothetical protein ES332_A07G211200v1 [Gossypium tomentosum]|uniref:Uncharacterized protein n=1 Tax=Gossypium tomentosum TaxID=34277 RepID=A0A5D2PYK0_GOSTO|nr:hypothetical protein ES332_A07G211200v1 [Gossypium tomentosum]TYI20091.1 hypothetical protein ES332_A07G211200v1 [Gossypium tomentosum]
MMEPCLISKVSVKVKGDRGAMAYVSTYLTDNLRDRRHRKQCEHCWPFNSRNSFAKYL